jgi:hypothetical protein
VVPFVFVPRGLVCQGVGAGRGRAAGRRGLKYAKRVCLFVYVTYLGVRQ